MHVFSVEVSFFDNMDLLTSTIDEGFEKAGFTRVSGHTWKLNGELKANKRKITEVFQNRCKEIDKDRTLIPSIGRYWHSKVRKRPSNSVTTVRKKCFPNIHS